MSASADPHRRLLPRSPVRHRTFWQRRLVDPVLALLTQGVTPDKIAFTLAMGTGLSMFPFLGFTSLLNLGVGLWLRLNQPILQTLNQLLWCKNAHAGGGKLNRQWQPLKPEADLMDKWSCCCIQLE